MIYFNSDSTSNGVSNIVATFDVGYSQDIAAVDIQNKVADGPGAAPARGQAVRRDDQEDVDRHGLRRQPDLARRPVRRQLPRQLRADLRRRRPQADQRASATSTSSAASTPCGSGSTPTAWPTCRSRPTEVIQAIQQENVQAAAGKIGGRPVPTGQEFEYPITVKGRLEKVERVRGDHRPPQRRRLDRPPQGRRPRRARRRRTTRRPATSTASPPAASRSTSTPTPTPWTSSSRSAQEMDRLQDELPARGSTTRSPTTRPTTSTRTSTRSSTR